MCSQTLTPLRFCCAKTLVLKFQQFFFELFLIDKPALFFLQHLSNLFFDTHLLKSNFLVNQIGFSTEKCAFSHLSCTWMPAVMRTWQPTVKHIGILVYVARGPPNILRFLHKSKGLLYKKKIMSMP